MMYQQKDCSGVKEIGFEEDGIYTIKRQGVGFIDVYCDQTTGGGGWTVSI